MTMYAVFRDLYAFYSKNWLNDMGSPAGIHSVTIEAVRADYRHTDSYQVILYLTVNDFAYNSITEVLSVQASLQEVLQLYSKIKQQADCDVSLVMASNG